MSLSPRSLQMNAMYKSGIDFESTSKGFLEGRIVLPLKLDIKKNGASVSADIKYRQFKQHKIDTHEFTFSSGRSAHRKS